MNTSRIKELNDAFRTTFIGGQVMFTSGVSELPQKSFVAVVQSVKLFQNFTNDNDPNGEHDFGSFDVEDEKFFWKIDYYDKSLEFGSPNPSNSDVTKRVLTIMLANEY